MSVLQFLRILYKNIILLILIPLVMAFVVYILTQKDKKTYISSTIIYTGLASGYNIESKGGDKVDFFATNNAFDNLINIIKSKETMEDVSLCLLTQHLMLDKPSPTIISYNSYMELKKIVPKDVKFLVDKSNFQKTFEHLKQYKNKNETNFIYELINLNHRHYSLGALSKILVKRIQSSDLIEITYAADDPGICMQTLIFITKIFTENYKILKSTQTDDVVRYFEEQVARTSNNLKVSEDELLQFNKDNKIINYYEQTKYIAAKKEDLDVHIQNIQMDYAASISALKEIESKLTDKERIYLKSEDIIKKRNKLAAINSRISINEIYGNDNQHNTENIASLKKSSYELQRELEDDINQLYLYGHSREGLPLSDLLTKWLSNSIKKEESKASLDVLNKRKNEFGVVYSQFAPLGATLKRIERKIGVTENEYLELLHSLTLAKLKQQNAQHISSALKVVDKPYFPLKPKESKRKLFVIIAALLGFALTLFVIILLEYFDNSIKTPEKIISLTNLSIAGMFPQFIKKNLSNKIDVDYVYNRSIEMLTQNLKLKYNTNNSNNIPGKPILIIIYSIRAGEGKTLIGEKLSQKFRDYGENALFINYRNSNLLSKNIKSRQEYVKSNDNLFYEIDNNFFEINSFEELLFINSLSIDKKYKYIFIELPALLHYTFPIEIVREADISLIITKARRSWNKADDTLLNLFKEIVNENNYIVLNGVDLYVLESIIGEIPKKRSKFRIILKKIIELQFHKNPF